MSQIFNSIIGTQLSLKAFLLCFAAALLCGLITAFVANFKVDSTKSFTISLIILPVIVSTVIMMVNGNVGTGVAVMGAFSLVRFRSVPGKARDIALIFLAMTAGLATSAGYIYIALIFTLLSGGVILLLNISPSKNDGYYDLRITIPENISFSDAFSSVFSEYTTNAKLIGVKTTNMGSLYKLSYRIKMKNKEQLQKMIDELRCRNGNLEIAVTQILEGSEEL